MNVQRSDGMTPVKVNNLAAKHSTGKGGVHNDQTPEWLRRKEKAQFKKQVKQLRVARNNKHVWSE